MLRFRDVGLWHSGSGSVGFRTGVYMGPPCNCVFVLPVGLEKSPREDEYSATSGDLQPSRQAGFGAISCFGVQGLGF